MLVKPEEVIKRLGIAEGSRVADFGAGSGHWTIALGKRVGPKGNVYAIDVQKELLSSVLSRAREEGLKNIEVIWGDFDTAGGSKIAASVVDYAVLANTLFQLENKKVAAEEIKRVLKPSGKLLLVDWKDSFSQMGPHKDMVVKKEGGEQIFRDAGFKVEESFDVGNHQWGMILENL